MLLSLQVLYKVSMGFISGVRTQEIGLEIRNCSTEDERAHVFHSDIPVISQSASMAKVPNSECAALSHANCTLCFCVKKNTAKCILTINLLILGS